MINYEKLVHLLDAKGLSQSFVSTKIGMARGYLKDCRRLKTDIPIDRLERIASILGTSATYLLDETEDPSPLPQKPNAISIDLWEKINRDPSALRFLELIYSMSEKEIIELEKFFENLRGIDEK